jgi:hypothetical protein
MYIYFFNMKVCKPPQFQIWVGARGEMCLRDISSRQNECFRVVIFMFYSRKIFNYLGYEVNNNDIKYGAV